MWVEGDLKDQLGLKHHKVRQNRISAGSPLESAPIFHEDNRSLSELENSYDPFSAAYQGSRGISTNPLMTQITDSPHIQHMASSYDPLGASLQSTSTSRDTKHNIKHASGVSPQFSHHTASDLPQPLQVTSLIPDSPNSTSTSLQRPDVVQSAVPRGSPTSTMPSFSVASHLSPSTLLVPPTVFGRAYDSRMRAPSQHDPRDPSSVASDPNAIQRTPSEMSHTSSASFATANDEFEDEERASSVEKPPTSSISGDMEAEPRPSTPDEDDRSTLKEHRRRQSEALSEYSAMTWEGARAM